ncbi:MAG: DHH family phosphoesterase [Oscillospiraceae bacterium]|nr:DHH family phosphoesterase [Oscillospiraceae bacterium]MBP3519913.1 DHH family phosphoesterase [Oscillospiraceae bacterium]
MNKKGLSRLLEPSFQLYFIVLAAFALVTALSGKYLLAVSEALVILILFLYFRRRNALRRREIMSYIENISGDIDVATKDTVVNAPLPMVIFRPDTGEVIWSNNLFLHITGEKDHLFDRRLTEAVPDFDSRWLMEGKSQCPTEVYIGERRYQVFGRLVHTNDKDKRSYLATTYWVDVTEFSTIQEEFYGSRPVVLLLLMDNYEEVFKGIGDNIKTAMQVDINRRLDEWAAPTGGMLCRYDRDRYLLIVEARGLQALIDSKFDILDQVREVVNPNGLPVTLSIGAGRDADSFAELFQYASLSLEMALSRGGDQAVVKNKFNFDFYGGRAKETERQTKVKSRVMANALNSLIGDASQVFVMGHAFPDLDCVGPAAGIAAIARKRGTDIHIIRGNDPSPADAMMDRLAALPQYADVFLSPTDAIVRADPQSLLVVVDTNRPEQVLSRDLLESINRVAVIDHHRRAASYIEGATLSFHEPYASSASELVTDLLQYILKPEELLREEADALLAGIVLDSKNFVSRTGSRTFESAAYLRRAGADTDQVRSFFAADLPSTIARYDIIRQAQLYRDGIAIAVLDHPVDRVTAAKAADELLTVAGVDASFVLFPGEDGRIILSARSVGKVNVQVILEMLGGGGNATGAGAQVSGKSLDEVCGELTTAIDKYFETE